MARSEGSSKRECVLKRRLERGYRAGISQSCNTEFQKLAMDVIDITDGWNEAVMMCR